MSDGIKCPVCNMYDVEITDHGYGETVICIKDGNVSEQFGDMIGKIMARLKGMDYPEDIRSHAGNDMPIGIATSPQHDNADIKSEEKISMAEPKAVAYDLVVSDKGKKAVNVGIAFRNDLGKVPFSITLSLTKLRQAISNTTVSTRKEEPSKTQWPNRYEGDETVRIAAFKKTRKPLPVGSASI